MIKIILKTIPIIFCLLLLVSGLHNYVYATENIITENIEEEKEECFFCKKEIDNKEYKYCPYCGRTLDVKVIKIVLKVLCFIFLILCGFLLFSFLVIVVTSIYYKEYKSSFLTLILSCCIFIPLIYICIKYLFL